MKKFSIAAVALLSTLASLAQSDPVLMRINGKDVTRSEFEYSYNKNNAEGVIDKKTINEYVDLFVNYKLKVAAAEAAHLDTLTSYRNEFHSYRDQQLRPYLLDTLAEEKEIANYYERMKESIGDAGLIHPAHIFLRVAQKATDEQKEKAKARIDSIYKVLKAGGDFETLAKACSEDPGSAKNGGLLPWIGPKQTLKEFEDAAYALKVGEMSKPFLSSAGYHIIMMKERKPLDPYSTLRPQIKEFLESRGLSDKVVNDRIDTLVKSSNGRLTAELVMDSLDRQVEASNSDIRNLVREYHDGLLLYEISNRTVWDKAVKDSVGLEKFYKKNKKKYYFDSPRFKGVVFYCKNQSDVPSVKAALKGVDYDNMVSKLRATFNNDSVLRVKVDRGVFKKGDNANVDKVVFGEGSGKELKGFPYVDVYGKTLKNKPESYADVLGLVTADYQNQLESQWIKELRQKYNVEINQEVLKTVNNHNDK